MTTKRLVLLNPGPVTLTEGVRQALTGGDWCHREPEFADLTREILQGLEGVYDGTEEYSAVMLTGSGTAAVEAMVATLTDPAIPLLVVSNGVYGERLTTMARAHRRPVVNVTSRWEDPIDLDAVAAKLDAHPEIGQVALIHHETTTGRLNNVEALARLCANTGRTLLLDGVSSFGAERIDFANWPITAVAGTANKCLHGVPGLSFVLARTVDLEARGFLPTSVYLDLRSYHRLQQDDGYSPFTQSVQVAFALRQALAEHRAGGGWATRRQRYAAVDQRIRTTLASHGIEPLLPFEDSSVVLRAYARPPGFDYERFHHDLKDDGFVIYGGQGYLAASAFRIANMGAITDDDLDRLEASLARAMARQTGDRR